MNLRKFFREKLKKHDDSVNFTCDICGREVFEGERICRICDAALPHNNQNICPACGRKVVEPGYCLECKAQPLKVDMARSAFVHEGEAARLVVRFKRGEKYLYRTLAEPLVPLEEGFHADSVVYIPMTKEREKKRGYNQSELLAARLAELCNLELLPVLEKAHETDAQKFLGRRDREKNLEGSFRLTSRKAVKGRRIIIVDDTLTTGATVSEIAGMLKRAGAEAVFGLTVTSVQNKYPFGKPDSTTQK